MVIPNSERPSVYDSDSVWLIFAEDTGTVNDDPMRIAQTRDGVVLMFHLRRSGHISGCCLGRIGHRKGSLVM